MADRRVAATLSILLNDEEQQRILESDELGAGSQLQLQLPRSLVREFAVQLRALQDAEPRRQHGT